MRNFERPEIVRLIELLTRGALAQHNRRCLLIFDRDGQAYDVAIPREECTSSLADYEFGERAFWHLRITDKRLELMPQE